MAKTKNKVIRTFCFYSILHIICTKDFLKQARLGASFDSVSRMFLSCERLFSGILDSFVDETFYGGNPPDPKLGTV